MTPVSVAAAIPIFNEGAAIGAVIAGVRPFVDRILVVDDGSTDGSGILAAGAGAEVATHDGNRGKGVALRTALGWAKARPDVSELVLIDGDGQHDLRRMFNRLNPARLAFLMDLLERETLRGEFESGADVDFPSPGIRRLALRHPLLTARLATWPRFPSAWFG